MHKNNIIENISEIKVGILGAGQLGRMMMQKAVEWDIDVRFLDKSSDFPAGQISRNFVEGDFKSYDDVYTFGKDLDVISIEIENVNVDALRALENEGVKVRPSAHAISLIKDKGLQKQFYSEKSLPTSEFELYANKADILTAIEENRLSIPFVQKSREAGYDGKGVSVINSPDDFDKLMDTASVVENLVDIKKEVAIIIARSADNSIRYYDTVEMVFDDRANLLDYLLSPADISESHKEEIRILAERIVQELNYEGLLAIELFIDNNDQILINEIAPRTHNSGHHTIDACNCSQFEMQLRTLLDLPLGDSSLRYNYAGIVNLVGDSDTEVGKVRYPGLEVLLGKEKVFPHIYGKHQVKPFRKMGHVTICADEKSDLLEKIEFVKSNISVRS